MNRQAKNQLRFLLMVSSWAYWIGVPLGVATFPGELPIPSPRPFPFQVAIWLVTLGGIAWLVVLSHVLLEAIRKRWSTLLWLAPLLLVGPFASPFYVMLKIPKLAPEEETGPNKVTQDIGEELAEPK